MSELKELFEKMTVDNLSYVIKALGIKATARIKADKIQILINYYSNKDCIKKIWESLDAYEKDLLTCIVQSNYQPHSDDLNNIVKKHSVNLDDRSFRYGRSKYFRENSKLGAIIIDGQTPDFIRLKLAKIVAKYKPEFKIQDNVDTDDYEGRIVDRDDRYSDCDMLIKFVNNQNVPATKAAGLMNKNSLIKFHKIAGSYEDIFKGDILEIGEIRKSSETTVSYGMVQLLLAADVLEIYKEKFKLGTCVTYFIGLDMAQKAKFLFDRFMTDNHIIDECRSITANKLFLTEQGYRYNITSYEDY